MVDQLLKFLFTFTIFVTHIHPGERSPPLLFPFCSSSSYFHFEFPGNNFILLLVFFLFFFVCADGFCLLLLLFSFLCLSVHPSEPRRPSPLKTGVPVKNLPRFLSDSQILSEEVSDQGDENQPRDKSEGSIRQLKIVLSEPQDAGTHRDG